MKFGSFISRKKKSTGIFINDGGEFKELETIPNTGSINDIAEYLGYNPIQLHTYFGGFAEQGIHTVHFEIFSDNIVFVLTSTDVVKLSQRKVQEFLTDFKASEEYNMSIVSYILEEGISNSCLTNNFLSQVLKPDEFESDGVFYSSRLEMYLFFSDGKLVDKQPSDGLSTWAKYFKNLNPDFVLSYEKAAKKYRGNKIDEIIWEVNVQMDSLADLPDAIKNEYCHLHTNDDGTINFRMLKVCHYEDPITLSEFKAINLGRIDIRDGGYQIGKFIYTFSSMGEIENIRLK